MVSDSGWVNNLLKSMTWRPLIFSPFEAWGFHPHMTGTDLTACIYDGMCMCMHIMCLSSHTLWVTFRFFLLSVTPSSIFRLCRESAESIRPCVGFTGNEDLSQSEGAYERPLRQRERLVSWNSQEATARDQDCWLMKEIIYSEAVGKLKSFATFRG